MNPQVDISRGGGKEERERESSARNNKTNKSDFVSFFALYRSCRSITIIIVMGWFKLINIDYQQTNYKLSLDRMRPLSLLEFLSEGRIPSMVLFPFFCLGKGRMRKW